MKYCIIGNGAAGTDAALGIRTKNEEADIEIFTSSNHHLYYRPKLVEYVGSQMKPEDLILHNEDLYIQKKIKVNLNCKIVSIENDKKIILDSKGKEHKYDFLIIATGARNFLPPVEGSNLKGVFSLRNFGDADLINSYAESVKKIVIAGGGLLGLETANSLLRVCKDVTVVEIADNLLPRQLDDQGGGFLKQLLIKKGLKFICGTSVKQINGNEKIESLTLSTGEKIEADMLVFSAGIRPEIDLALSSGIKCDKGIVVNNHLETSVKGIYAAGDCIQMEGKLFGLWISAKEQGKTAGLSACGMSETYKGSYPPVVLKITGIDLFSAGYDPLSEEFANAEKKVVINDSVYKKIYYKNGKALATMIIGDSSAALMARKLMSGTLSLDEFLNTMK
ncbi:MAG TPA: FAD-dependent oxidoreductase [Spirochaetota bacterium]|nr:FAD-dependent oxidoreductase [Spirochaetota bacterium]